MKKLIKKSIGYLLPLVVVLGISIYFYIDDSLFQAIFFTYLCLSMYFAVEVEKDNLSKKYIAIYLFINTFVLMYFYQEIFNVIGQEYQ